MRLFSPAPFWVPRRRRASSSLLYFSASLATETAGQVTAQVGGAGNVMSGTPVCTAGVLTEQAGGLCVVAWSNIVARGFTLPFVITTLGTQANGIYFAFDAATGNGYMARTQAGANASAIVRLAGFAIAATLLTWTASDGDSYVLTVPSEGAFTIEQNGGAAMSATVDTTYNNTGFAVSVNGGGEIQGPLTMSAA